MTLYREQINKIKNELYSKEDLLKQIIESKQFIDRKFSTKLDLDKIAGKAFLSKFHFLRLFKSVYGTTPHQYLITVRLEKAKFLLKSDLSVSEICTLVGFESPTTFAGLFKKYTGQSPSLYRTK